MCENWIKAGKHYLLGHAVKCAHNITLFMVYNIAFSLMISKHTMIFGGSDYSNNDPSQNVYARKTSSACYFVLGEANKSLFP